MKDRDPSNTDEMSGSLIWQDYSLMFPEISQWLSGFMPERRNMRVLPDEVDRSSRTRRFDLETEAADLVHIRYWQGKSGITSEYLHRYHQGTSIKFAKGLQYITLQWHRYKDMDRFASFLVAMNVESKDSKNFPSFGFTLSSTKENFDEGKDVPLKGYGDITEDGFRESLIVLLDRSGNKVQIQGSPPLFDKIFQADLPFWFTPGNQTE